MQDGTGLPPHRRTDTFIPHLSRLCRSTKLLQLPRTCTPAAAPWVSTAAFPLGSQALYLLPNTPRTELFEYKVPRDGRAMRYKNYKKTVPQPGYFSGIKAQGC